MTFRIRGLEAEQFAHLFALSDAELAAHGAVRKIADGPSPCRVSLTDATPGDEVILVNHEHHAVESPYRMRFAIYVREGEKTFDAVDAVPDQLRRRTLAVRGFDSERDDDRLGADRRHMAGRGDRTAVRRPAHALSPHPLCRTRLLRGQGRTRMRYGHIDKKPRDLPRGSTTLPLQISAVFRDARLNFRL